MDEDDQLERASYHATIRGARYSKLALIVGILALIWTIFADLTDNKAETPTKSSSQSSSLASNNKTQPGGESASTSSGIAEYFKNAAYRTDDWRAGQAFWQLTLWWLGVAAVFLWLAYHELTTILLPAALTQALYLFIFFPSLSGFGMGLSVGLWVIVTLIGLAIY